MKKKREVKKSNQLQTVVFFLLIIGAFDGTKKILKKQNTVCSWDSMAVI